MPFTIQDLILIIIMEPEPPIVSDNDNSTKYTDNLNHTNTAIVTGGDNGCVCSNMMVLYAGERSVGFEPVGAYAGGDFEGDATTVGAFHVGGDYLLEARELVGDDVEYQFVMDLHYHA